MPQTFINQCFAAFCSEVFFVCSEVFFAKMAFAQRFFSFAQRFFSCGKLSTRFSTGFSTSKKGFSEVFFAPIRRIIHPFKSKKEKYPPVFLPLCLAKIFPAFVLGRLKRAIAARCYSPNSMRACSSATLLTPFCSSALGLNTFFHP